MKAPPVAWKRTVSMVLLFAIAFASILWRWHAAPPLPATEITGAYGRNRVGDLGPVLRMLALQLVIAVLALQPLRREPRLGWMLLVAVLYGFWGVLGLLVGLHAPPVATLQAVFGLLAGLLLGVTALAILFRVPSPRHRDQPT